MRYMLSLTLSSLNEYYHYNRYILYSTARRGGERLPAECSPVGGRPRASRCILYYLVFSG